VKCREVADQNRFVNNPSEIVVNVVRSWFRITQITQSKRECDNQAPQILCKGRGEDGVRAITYRPRVAYVEKQWFRTPRSGGSTFTSPGAAAMAFLLVAGLAFGVSQPAGATGTTRYVSTSAVGSDTSCSSPGYSTIQSAVTALRPATRLWCARDVRRRCGQCEGSNLPGREHRRGWRHAERPESIVSSIGVTNANVTIDGFEIDPGSSGSGVALSFTGGTSETVQDNIITDYGYDSAVAQGTEGVTLIGTSGMLFQDNLVENPTPTGQVQYTNAAAQDAFMPVPGFNNTQILNNVFEGASTYPAPTSVSRTPVEPTRSSAATCRRAAPPW